MTWSQKLRSCLQDDAENPRFIETVPRQSYRFLAPVHQIQSRVNITSAKPVTATDTDERWKFTFRCSPSFPRSEPRNYQRAEAKNKAPDGGGT